MTPEKDILINGTISLLDLYELKAGATDETQTLRRYLHDAKELSEDIAQSVVEIIHARIDELMASVRDTPPAPPPDMVSDVFASPSLPPVIRNPEKK